MTDATTADKFAAWQLIEAHRLCACPMSDTDGFNVFQSHVGSSAGIGTTLADAVKDWAERAGVPWPSVKVVQMWALDGAIGVPIYGSRILAEQAAHRNNCRVVPCEVVIRTETEAAS